MDTSTPVLATFHAYDADEVMTYAHVYDYSGALYDIEFQVREWHKHGHTFKTADEVIERLYALVNEIRVARNISIT